MDEDLQDLRFRINDIEQTINNASTTTMESHTSNIVFGSLRHAALVDRVSHLETLLAASELDNKNLNKEIYHLTATNSQLVHYHNEELKARDCEISHLKQKLELLQIEINAKDVRYKSATEYVNSLPSEEELTDAKRAISDLERENYLLEEKDKRKREQIHQYQQELISKEKQLQTALSKLEDLKPLEEAQHRLAKKKMCEFDEKTQHEYTIVQESKLIQAGKIIKSIRQKLLKCDAEKRIGLSKIQELTGENKSLHEEVLYFNCQIKKLNEIIKLEVEKKLQVEEICAKLQLRVEQEDKFHKLQNEQLGYLERLASEIDLCVSEMGNLIDICMKIGQGEDLPIDCLVGLSPNEFENFQQSSIAELNSHSGSRSSEIEISISQDIPDSSPCITLEWILNRSSKMSELRKTVALIKVRILDVYADSFEGKLESCSLQ